MTETNGPRTGIEVLAGQEALLRFPSFTRASAWDLGVFMIERARRLGITIAVSIRTAGGATVFQHLPEGTNLLNERWMRRKFNTVTTFESSSLKAALECSAKGEDLARHGLDEAEYALCGGGFPIRTASSEELIGVLIASNLHHVEDHGFITGSLAEYLGVEGVPEYVE